MGVPPPPPPGALYHQYVKPKRIAVGVSSLWLGYSILQAILVFITSVQGFYDQKRTLCLYQFQANVVVDAVNFTILASSIIFVLIIFLAYLKVFRFVSHHNHGVASNLQQANTLRRETKVTKTLVTVVLGFVVCWVPVIVIQFIYLFVDSKLKQLRIPNFVYLFQVTLIYASSAINPFIYGLTNKQFRKEYLELLRVLCASTTQVVPAAIQSS